MKRIAVLAVLLACVLALFVCDHAQAISREEDNVRDVTNLFKAPTVLPPNNALRPNFDGSRNGVNGAPISNRFSATKDRARRARGKAFRSAIILGSSPWSRTKSRRRKAMSAPASSLRRIGCSPPRIALIAGCGAGRSMPKLLC